ncbi:MAG: hypothetical protein ACREJT_17665, partial [Myxococcota bacterium]
MRSILAYAAAGAIGCGGFAYRPFTLIDPSPHDDSSFVAGSLRLRVHVADERVDVSLENAGPDTIFVDWFSARITISPTPDEDIEHRVARPMTLAMAWSMNSNPREFRFAAPTFSLISPATHQD